MKERAADQFAEERRIVAAMDEQRDLVAEISEFRSQYLSSCVPHFFSF